MKYLFPFLLLLAFFSCSNKKSGILESQSSDGKLKIQVWGEQTGALEPWKVYVATDYLTEKDTVFTELHADAVDANSVQFSWEGNRTCIVNLKHQDGQINQVPIRYHDNP